MRLRRLRDKFLYKTDIALVEHPFEVWLALLASTMGPLLMLTGPENTPNSLDDLMPAELVTVWAATLTLGGLGVLIGKFKRLHHIERAGMAMLSSATFIYALGLAFSSYLTHNGALFAMGTYLTFSFAGVIRYMVLGHTIDRIRESKK